MAYSIVNRDIKLPNILALAMPEFMVLKHQQTGVLTGRLWVPIAWTKLPAFAAWLESVEVITVKYYPTGVRLWFAAPLAEYERLAGWYPHWTNAANNATAEYLKEAKAKFQKASPQSDPQKQEQQTTMVSQIQLATNESGTVTKEVNNQQSSIAQHIPDVVELNKLTKPKLLELTATLQDAPIIRKSWPKKKIVEVLAAHFRQQSI